jgi:Domain of unknown function (DUF4345)
MRESTQLLSRVTLFAAGLISLVIGVAITFLTKDFYASTGIDLQGDASLYSEIRASGAVLLAVAVFLLAALVRPAWQQAAILVSAIYFSAYGLARLYSAFVTGWPSAEITTAMVAELAVGAVAAGLILRSGRQVER